MIETLGNIGEFLGSVGVLITLIYLAMQVRQNTRFAQIEAGTKAREEFTELTDGNERYVRLLLACDAGGALSGEDHAHMVERFYSIMFTMQNLQYRQRMGFDEVNAEGVLVGSVKWALSSQTSQRIWEIAKTDFDPQFCQFVQESISSEQGKFNEVFEMLQSRSEIQ